MSYGTDMDLAISFQNSFGTSSVQSAWWVPIISESIGINKPPLISQSMRGVFEEGEHYEGANSNDGAINTEINPITIGALFKAAMGAPITSGVGPYVHVFKPLQADWGNKSALPPVSILKKLDATGSDYIFSDMNCTMMELNIANGEFLNGNFSFVGGAYSAAFLGGASWPTDKEFTWDSTSISVAGIGINDISQLNIKLDNALEAKYTLNAVKTPSRIKRNGFRTLAIAGTLLFDSQDEYQEFLSQSERVLRVTMTNEDSDIIFLTVPMFRHTEFKPVADGPGEVEVSFTSKGVYSVTSATSLQIDLTNDQSVY